MPKLLASMHASCLETGEKPNEPRLIAGLSNFDSNRVLGRDAPELDLAMQEFTTTSIPEMFRGRNVSTQVMTLGQGLEYVGYAILSILSNEQS